MDIPFGFQLDPQSGLYYKEEDGRDGGSPVRIVTWLDPQSGATQQVNYPVEPPIAESEPDFELPLEPLPLDEGEQLLEPPPEPILTPTGLPVQNPYAAASSQAAYPPPPPMFTAPTPTILQEAYNTQGMPQPFPKKESKLPVIVLIVGIVVVLAAIGVCGLQFGWFGGRIVQETTASSQSPISSSLPSVSSTISQASGSASIFEGLSPSVKIEYKSPTQANITLSGVPFRKEYQASMQGVEKGKAMYYRSVVFDEFELAFGYYCQDKNDPGIVTVDDMECYLFQASADGRGTIIDTPAYEISGDNITFYDVVLPTGTDMDLSSADTLYGIFLIDGNETLPLTNQKAQITSVKQEETPAHSLANEYHYVDVDTDMQVVLTMHQDRKAFELDADLGGSTYHAAGGFALQTDGTLVLESADTSPAWQGVARFSIQADCGLRLESPQYLGVLPAGGVLVAASPKPAEKAPNQPINDEKFLYAGLFTCADTRISKEYCPTIQLNEDMSFTMNINNGGAMVTGTGTFVWDIQPQMLYLNFREIAGESYANGSLMADVQILNENKLGFLSDEFGLMGYDNQKGIFIKQ